MYAKNPVNIVLSADPFTAFPNSLENPPASFVAAFKATVGFIFPSSPFPPLTRLLKKPPPLVTAPAASAPAPIAAFPPNPAANCLGLNTFATLPAAPATPPPPAPAAPATPPPATWDATLPAAPAMPPPPAPAPAVNLPIPAPAVCVAEPMPLNILAILAILPIMAVPVTTNSALARNSALSAINLKTNPNGLSSADIKSIASTTLLSTFSCFSARVNAFCFCINSSEPSCLVRSAVALALSCAVPKVDISCNLNFTFSERSDLSFAPRLVNAFDSTTILAISSLDIP